MVGAVVLSGCTSSRGLLACQEENRNLTNNYQDTKEQLAVANTRLSSLEEQLAQAKRDYERLQSTLDWSLSNASQNNVSIDKLVDQINESNQYIRHLVEVKSKSDSLNMVLTNNLTRSLSKEELREVDVQVLKGVVYISLADNMLFRSGGYEINDRAAETLSKIAKIIMDYKDYDVLASLVCAPPAWCSTCRTTMAWIPSDLLLVAAASTIPWLTTPLMWDVSATAVHRSSSLRNSTSSWTLLNRPRMEIDDV